MTKTHSITAFEWRGGVLGVIRPEETEEGGQVESVEPVRICPDYCNNRQVIINPHTLISSEEPLCHSCFVRRLTKAPF